VVFFHGQTFPNGGWFDASASKPRLEIKTSPAGEWSTVCTLSDYPDTTDTNPAGLKAGEQFNCELPEPVRVVAVRVIGKPASGANPKQNFATCAELQAFTPEGSR
jgi:uncharacterized protein